MSVSGLVCLSVCVFVCVCVCLCVQVYKVLFPYMPQKDDELELQDGDYAYVSTTDQGQTGDYRVTGGGAWYVVATGNMR